MSSKRISEAIADFVAVKKSVRYFYQSHGFGEPPRHDPTMCIVCHPAAAHLRTPLEGATAVVEQMVRIEVGKRQDAIGFLQDMVEDDEDDADSPKERRIRDYLIKTPVDRIAQDWRANIPFLKDFFVGHVEYEIDSANEFLHGDHAVLTEIRKRERSRYKRYIHRLYKLAPSIAADPYLDVDHVLFEMDALFDSAPFYPLSIHDELAMRLGLPGLRRVPAEIVQKLSAFVDSTIGPYYEKPRMVDIPDLTRMDPALKDYLEEVFLPYLRVNYPEVHRQIEIGEMQFLSRLPSVLSGEVLTEDDILRGVALSPEDVSHLVDHNPVDILDYTREIAFDLALSLFPFYLKDTGEALASFVQTRGGYPDEIRVAFRRAMKGDPDDVEEANDIFIEHIGEYCKEANRSMFKTHRSYRKFPNDEYFRAYVRLKVLPAYAKPLWPWLYMSLWRLYCAYIVDDWLTIDEEKGVIR